MQFRTRIWGAGKVLLLLASLVATYVIFAAIGMRVALGVRVVQVPDVVGHQVNEASEAMTARGLTLRVDDTPRSDPRVPAGRIVQQEPAAGAQARQQRTVRVWLSAGVRERTVPPLIGQTERAARIRLQEDGLDVAAVTELHSTDYATDAVVAQAPPPSTKGDRVSLLVNRGEHATTFVMPDLIGADGGAASELLRSNGLRVTIVGQQPSPGIPPGTVIRQQPPSGFQVGAADPISLEVSR